MPGRGLGSRTRGLRECRGGSDAKTASHQNAHRQLYVGGPNCEHNATNARHAVPTLVRKIKILTNQRLFRLTQQRNPRRKYEWPRTMSDPRARAGTPRTVPRPCAGRLVRCPSRNLARSDGEAPCPAWKEIMSVRMQEVGEH